MRLDETNIAYSYGEVCSKTEMNRFHLQFIVILDHEAFDSQIRKHGFADEPIRMSLLFAIQTYIEELRNTQTEMLQFRSGYQSTREAHFGISRISEV